MNHKLAVVMIALPLGMSSLVAKSASAEVAHQLDTPASNLVAQQYDDHWNNDRRNDDQRDRKRQEAIRREQARRDELRREEARRDELRREELRRDRRDDRVWVPGHYEAGFLGIGRHWVDGHWENR